MKELVQAVLNVMEDCKGIDKSMTVGDGNNSYKGVSDKDVKLKIGGSMQKHGLIILPTKIESLGVQKTEREEYSKRKTKYFTEVITTYKLMHTSGENIDICGYGHGVDTQDKGAGKATTYALKYTLLYSFLVATGYIDDTDNHASDEEITFNEERFEAMKQYAIDNPKADIKAMVDKVLKEETVSKALREKLVLFITPKNG